MGRSKQLMAWRGKSLVERTVALALSCAPAQVVVVVGADSARVIRQLDGQPVTVVENADWQNGQGGSVAAGAAALDDRLAALVLLCDQPLLTAADLQRLTAAWRERPDRPAAAADESGYLGAPALFPPDRLPALRGLRGESGARSLLHGTDTTRVAMPAARYDVDTRDQWRALSEQHGDEA